MQRIILKIRKKITSFNLASKNEDNILETKSKLKIEPGREIIKGIKLKEIQPSSREFKIISRDEDDLLYEKDFEVVNEGTFFLNIILR